MIFSAYQHVIWLPFSRDQASDLFGKYSKKAVDIDSTAKRITSHICWCPQA